MLRLRENDSFKTVKVLRMKLFQINIKYNNGRNMDTILLLWSFYTPVENSAGFLVYTKIRHVVNNWGEKPI